MSRRSRQSSRPRLAALLVLAFAGCDPRCAEPPGPLDGGPPPGAIVTVLKSGDGTGSIESDPEGIDCDIPCTEQELVLTNETPKITLTAEPARDALFESWTCLTTRAGAPDPQVIEGELDVVAFDEAAPESLTDLTVECTARFRQLYTLLVIRRGDGDGDVVGTLPAPGGGTRIDCGEKCTAGYFVDEADTLTAVPATGSVFAGWSFDCASAGTDPEVTVVLDDDKTCEARFELSPP